MSDDVIERCPYCGYHDIYKRTKKFTKPADDKDYRCPDCGESFDDPERGEREGPAPSADAVLSNALERLAD